MQKTWSLLRLSIWFVVVVFVVLYPMLVSIYVFFPLLIGFSGLLAIRGLESGQYRYIFIPLFYMINIEINLSLPLMMIAFSTMLYYLTLYDRVMILKKCRFCVSVISVVLIDVYYILILLGYDLMMDTQSVVVDKLLWYSLGADVALAVF